MIAYCGINCAKCPAYRLPRLGEKLHMRGLFQWMLRKGIERARRRQKLALSEQSESNGSEGKSQESKGKTEEPGGYIICDGCTMIDARCLKPCLECAVRCCAMETGVAHCARCEKFPCERLQRVWKITVFKDAQSRLEKLHAGLPTRRA
jgi:hypothetical protein